MKSQPSEMKALVEGYYDLQHTRIQAGQRIVANTYAKLGLKPGEKKAEGMSDDENKILKLIVQDYQRMTDGIVLGRRKIHEFLVEHGTELISTPVELALAKTYVEYLRIETDAKKAIENILDNFPIWTEFLEGIKGVGPLMAGTIISYLDPHKARYPSSFWKYCGLDVGPDGRGRGRFSEHLVDVTYTAKDGTEKTKKSLTYNPWVKTKLVGVLSDVLIRKRAAKYYDLYIDYKNRMANHEQHKDKPKIVHHRKAIRYMIKIFLLDLWKVWRGLEGLEVHEPYHVAKLGMRDHDVVAAKGDESSNCLERAITT